MFFFYINDMDGNSRLKYTNCSSFSVFFKGEYGRAAKVHQKIVTVGVHTEGAEILQNNTTEKRNSMGLRLNPLRRITEKSTVSETQPRLLGTYFSVYKSPYHDSVHNSINDEYEQNEANTASRELQREVIKTSDIDPNVGGAHRKIQLYHYGLSWWLLQYTDSTCSWRNAAISSKGNRPDLMMNRASSLNEKHLFDGNEDMSDPTASKRCFYLYMARVI